MLIAVGVALFSVVATGSAPSSGGGHVTALRRPTPRRAVSRPRSHSVAVGLRVMRVVDPTRSIQLPDGRIVPRTLVTDVRYPAPLGSGRIDAHDAPVARAGQPFPLIVFGHGFDVTPGLYAPLLRDWARAGYVVAAPVFPLENRDAPGGPNESDLANQPGDMHVVISRMLAASDSRGPWRGTVDPRAVAVAGQSDGGDTALAVADDPRFRDDRVDAAIILSGAEIPGIGSFAIHPGSPPLLATQGTADAVNPPSATLEFYASAPTPKYLLHLLAAGHLPPYSVPGPQLSAVERVSVAFLDRYLKHERGSVQRMLKAGRVPGVAQLDAHP